jgi:hypothetical protein
VAYIINSTSFQSRRTLDKKNGNVGRPFCLLSRARHAPMTSLRIGLALPQRETPEKGKEIEIYIERKRERERERERERKRERTSEIERPVHTLEQKNLSLSVARKLQVFLLLNLFNTFASHQTIRPGLTSPNTTISSDCVPCGWRLYSLWQRLQYPAEAPSLSLRQRRPNNI